MSEIEGVIKYQLELDAVDLAQLDAGMEGIVCELDQWRQILLRLGLVGQDPARYQGLGFGNLSRRYKSNGQFIITGTQTSGLPWLSVRDCALVVDFDSHANRLCAKGLTPPSSEAMTHAVLYRKSIAVGAVVHVHSPLIWRLRDALELWQISAAIEYGTPAMAQAVSRLWDAHADQGCGIFVMCGHQDGVVAWGDSTHSACMALIKTYHRAHRFEHGFDAL